MGVAFILFVWNKVKTYFYLVYSCQFILLTDCISGVLTHFTLRLFKYLLISWFVLISNGCLLKYKFDLLYVTLYFYYTEVEEVPRSLSESRNAIV